MTVIMDFLIVVRMVMLVDFFLVRVMVVPMFRLFTGMSMFMAVFKRMFMVVPVRMRVTVLLVAMFMSMLMLVFMLVGVVVFMTVFSLCHCRNPPSVLC